MSGRIEEQIAEKKSCLGVVAVLVNSEVGIGTSDRRRQGFEHQLEQAFEASLTQGTSISLFKYYSFFQTSNPTLPFPCFPLFSIEASSKWYSG